MNTLYKAYDDITASDAFKQRMVRTLQSEVAVEADDKKVVRFPVRKKTIAILIAAAVLVLTIGTAVAAATGLFTPNKSFSTPEYYTFWSKEDREKNGMAVPDVENAIEAANPKSVDYSIKMLPELENADELKAYRQENGLSAYSEENWGWIREIEPKIEEALVDGNVWSFNIRLKTDHGLDFAIETDENGKIVFPENRQYVGATSLDSFFTIDDSKKIIKMPGHSVRLLSITEDGCTLRVDWNVQDSESYRDNTSPWLDWGDEPHDFPFPTEGKIRFTMGIVIFDRRAQSSYSGTVAEIQYTFTFEASAGKDAENMIVNERPLSGSVVLTIRDFNEGKLHNEVVSLDGVVLEETLKYRSTGLFVQYKIKSAPEGWFEKYAWSFTWPYSYGKMTIMCIPEDEEATESVLQASPTGLSEGKYVGILPIFPSDYEIVRETHYKVQLIVDRIASLNGEEADENWVVEKSPGMTYSETLYHGDITYEHQVIAEFDLPMP